jgi:hypothetical protein
MERGLALAYGTGLILFANPRELVSHNGVTALKQQRWISQSVVDRRILEARQVCLQFHLPLARRHRSKPIPVFHRDPGRDSS